MANGIRTGDPRGFNKGRSLKFHVGSQVQEGWRTYRPKRCGNNNKDEDNSLKTLNDKNEKDFVCSQKMEEQKLSSESNNSFVCTFMSCSCFYIYKILLKYIELFH